MVFARKETASDPDPEQTRIAPNTSITMSPDNTTVEGTAGVYTQSEANDASLDSIHEANDNNDHRSTQPSEKMSITKPGCKIAIGSDASSIPVEPTTTKANATSPDDNNQATNSDNAITTAVPATESIFFTLPRELRDRIYKLVADSKDEIKHSMHLTVRLQKNQKPQLAFSAVGSMAHACRDLRREYQATQEKRVDGLLAGRTQNWERFADMRGWTTLTYDPSQSARSVTASFMVVEKDPAMRSGGELALLFVTFWFVDVEISECVSKRLYSSLAAKVKENQTSEEQELVQTRDDALARAKEVVWSGYLRYFALWAKIMKP